MSERVPKPSVVSWLVLVSVALSPVIFATAYSSYETAKWSVTSILVAIAVILWGVRAIRARPVRISAGRVALSAFAFGAFALLGVLWADVPMFGALQGVTWFVFVAVFLLIVAPAGRAIRFVEMALALAVGTGISAIFGLLDLAGVEVFTIVWDPLGPTGAFDSGEVAAAYYAVTVPVLIAASVRHGGAMRGVFGLAAALGAFHFGLVAPAYGLWAAFVAVAFVSVAMVLLQGFSRAVLLYPALAAFLSAMVVAGAGSFIGGDQGPSDANRLPQIRHESKRTMETIDSEIRNTSFAIGRVEALQNQQARGYLTGIAFDFFREKPIFGWGTGSWWTIQTNFVRENEPFVKGKFTLYPAFKSPHNGYLLAAAELGAVGFLLLLLWVVGVLSITATAMASKEEPENWALEHWGLASGAVGGLIFAAITSSFQMIGVGVSLFAVLAMLTRESAVLNEYKGMSAVWMFNEGGERRMDFTVLGGLIPIVVALGLLYPVATATVAKYHQGLGDHLMLRTQISRAVDEYEQAHSVFPYDGEVLYNIVAGARRGNKLDTVEAELKLASALRPYDARVKYLQALLQLQKGEQDEAIQRAREAVSLFPNYVAAYKVLALGHDKNRKYEEAANALRQALELDPPQEMRGPIHRELATYYSQALGKPKLALEHMQKSAELIDDPVERGTLEAKARELEKELKRQRLQREGKPIPNELMPGKMPGHEGHDHGPGQHDYHGEDPLPPIKGMPRPPGDKGGAPQ